MGDLKDKNVPVNKDVADLKRLLGRIHQGLNAMGRVTPSQNSTTILNQLAADKTAFENLFGYQLTQWCEQNKVTQQNAQNQR